MNYVFIGKLVNTHGIHGEVRIISNFKYKSLVFKKNFNLYIGKQYEKLIINSYRVHKNYDMVTFAGINDINDVLKYKGNNVYILRDELDDSVILNSDLIGFECIYKNNNIGIVNSFINNTRYDLFVIKNNNKEYIIPYLDEFISKIDLENKQIIFIDMEGLIDED